MELGDGHKELRIGVLEPFEVKLLGANLDGDAGGAMVVTEFLDNHDVETYLQWKRYETGDAARMKGRRKPWIHQKYMEKQ